MAYKSYNGDDEYYTDEEYYDYLKNYTEHIKHYCSTNETHVPMTPGHFWCIHVFLPIFCIIGILGILLTVIVLSHKNMSTSTNSYLISLAIADLSFLVIISMKCFETNFNKLQLYYYLVISYYAFIVLNTFLLASVWLTVMLAVERYIAICHSLRAISICTVTRARIIIVLIFVVAAVLHIPQFFTHEVIYFDDPCLNKKVPQLQKSEFGMNETFSMIDKWVNNSLMVILPFILLLILNGCLIREIHRSTNYLRYHLASDSNVQTIITTEEIKITMMLISVVVVFFICQGPYLVLNVLKSIHMNIVYKYYTELTYGTLLPLVLRSTFNFILYCWFSEKFWYTFKRTFCKPTCIISRVPTWIRSRVWNNSTEPGNSNNNRKISYINTKETTC